MIDAPQPPHKSSGFTEDARELRGVAAPAATPEEGGGWRTRTGGVGLEEVVEEEVVAASPPLFFAAFSCAAHKQEI